MLKIWKRLNELYGWFLMAVFGLVMLIGLWQVYDNYYMFNHTLDKSVLQYKPDPDDPAAAEDSPIAEDMVAWLTIDGTNIDYPVMQGKDNTYYLNTDPFGAYSLSGSIFLDSRCSRDFSDSYSIIYGHHMDYTFYRQRSDRGQLSGSCCKSSYGNCRHNGGFSISSQKEIRRGGR